MATRELAALGVSRATLHRMAEAGEIERAAFGVYRLPEVAASVHADWAALAKRVPSAVVCLTSAARFHRITQDMAWSLEVAVPREVGAVTGGKAFPVRLEVMHWRSEEAFSEGVQVHEIDGVPVRITSPERTVIDMFRFSGLNPAHPRHRPLRVTDESAIDCLHRALDPATRLADIDELDRLARVFGVKAALSPHLKSYNFAVNNGYQA
jgi:predicted transcriptional regulator of viral defense system